jgi:integrase
MALLYLTGLRLTEITSLRMTDLVRDSVGWWLRQEGGAPLALSEEFLRLLAHYRESIGLSALPLPWASAESDIPILGDCYRGIRPLTPSGAYKLVRDALRSAESVTKDRTVAEILRRATPSWLGKCGRARRIKMTAENELNFTEKREAQMAAAALHHLPGSREAGAGPLSAAVDRSFSPNAE